MNFNPDPNNQAQEGIFSCKIKKLPQPSLVFNNNNNVLQTSSQKHLGVTLDVKLTFDEHLNNVLNKVNKTIGLLHKLQHLLSRSTLITIHKAFVRPHLDYGDILFDQEQLGILRKRKYIKNLVLSPFGFVVGTENFAFFIKS